MDRSPADQCWLTIDVTSGFLANHVDKFSRLLLAVSTRDLARTGAVA